MSDDQPKGVPPDEWYEWGDEDDAQLSQKDRDRLTKQLTDHLAALPVVRFGHNRLPPGVCSACNGSGQLMNKEAEVEMCIWCKGTGRKEK